MSTAESLPDGCHVVAERQGFAMSRLTVVVLVGLALTAGAVSVLR